MGWNSWMALGWSITDADVRSVASYLASSGLQAAGYSLIASDDGWSAHRGPDGRIVPDPKRWPYGLKNLTDYLHARSFTFGLYTSASSVVCSGRPGSLFYEDIDAQSFAEWNISFIKVDNCAQYSYGNARYQAMADAINRTGHPLVISTEPFSLVPTPMQGEFSHMYRTTNDIEASYSSSMNRADLNANWLQMAGLAGVGAWADPDCIMCSHGGVSDAECRSIFAVWAVSKAPLLLGAVVQNFTAETLATVGNREVIAINRKCGQPPLRSHPTPPLTRTHTRARLTPAARCSARTAEDALGVPGRKLAANGQVSPFHVGLAPCTSALSAGAGPGLNGVTPADLAWQLRALPPTPGSAAAAAAAAGAGAVAIVHTASGRCLALRPYMKRTAPVPVLLPCAAADATQAWDLGGLPGNATSLVHLRSVALNLSLSAGESTVWGARHGTDNATLLDGAYGITNLTLEASVTPPPCTDRDCDGYEPRQTWYLSPLTGRLSLALFSGNMYRCFEGSSGCYDFSGAHLPVTEDQCLTRVAAISNDGLDTDVGGVHAWGGPLAGGDFAMVLENRDGAAAPAAIARWSWLEWPGVGDGSAFCVRELFSGRDLGPHVGGLTLPLPSHDAVVLRLHACAAPPPPPPAGNVTRLPASAFLLSPPDRWAPRSSPNGTVFLSKWGGASAVAASLVNATAPPFASALGLVYGMGSSNGYMRVSVNGAVLATLNTFSSNGTSYASEAVFQLKGLPNHPLWVVTVEATGTWQSGSKDSFIEIVGLNVYT